MPIPSMRELTCALISLWYFLKLSGIVNQWVEWLWELCNSCFYFDIYFPPKYFLYIIPVEPSFVTEFVTVEPFFIYVETLSICIFFRLNHLHLEIQIIIFALSLDGHSKERWEEEAPNHAFIKFLFNVNFFENQRAILVNKRTNLIYSPVLKWA